MSPLVILVKELGHTHLGAYNHRGVREDWQNGCEGGKSVSLKIKVCFPISMVLS